MTEERVDIVGTPSAVPNNQPLPPGWALATDDEGLAYYVHAAREETSWTDPRWPLPAGCEERRGDGGGAIFVRLETPLSAAVLIPSLSLSLCTLFGIVCLIYILHFPC
jgi:hypothetical protein